MSVSVSCLREFSLTHTYMWWSWTDMGLSSVRKENLEFYKQKQVDHISKFSIKTFADAVILLEEDHTLGPQLQPVHQHPHLDDGQHTGHRELHLPALQH